MEVVMPRPAVLEGSAVIPLEYGVHVPSLPTVPVKPLMLQRLTL